MFALTSRLTLRPGWPEDAPELARAIGHESVVSKLARAPWPYDAADARAFLALPRGPERPEFVIAERATGRLVGGIGVDLDAEEGPELGYWITPDAWGRGYATEAGRAVVAIARDALRLPKLRSGHFVDNPASGRVLRKLGFGPTGRIVPRACRARGSDVPCALFELDLGDARTGPMPLAA